MRLVIGNKNYSSWSFRPWLLMRHVGIPFSETLVPLYRPETRETLLQWTPSGKVPVLKDGERTIWESLAICEYVAERFPEKRLWPEDAGARAWARAISSEMHAGFAAMRSEMVMNVRRSPAALSLSPEAERDVLRVSQIWRECREQFQRQGPFLFGAFCVADAMFAPVVFRFRSYAFGPGPEGEKYMQAMEALPAWKEWKDAALAESWVIPGNER